MNKSNTNRKKTRRLLFQALFSATFTPFVEEDFLESFFSKDFEYEIDEEYLKEMIKIIFEKEEFFIEMIKKYSPKFDFEKMSILNVLPLYIAFAEIFYLKEEIPLKVSVNESIELAKIFSEISSKKIVNWVLHNIFNDYEELNKKKENYNWNKWYSIFKKS